MESCPDGGQEPLGAAPSFLQSCGLQLVGARDDTPSSFSGALALTLNVHVWWTGSVAVGIWGHKRDTLKCKGVPIMATGPTPAAAACCPTLTVWECHAI